MSCLFSNCSVVIAPRSNILWAGLAVLLDSLFFCLEISRHNYFLQYSGAPLEGLVKTDETESAILVNAVAIVSTGELLGLAFPLLHIVPEGGSLSLLCFPETIASAHDLYYILLYSSLCMVFSLSAIYSTFSPLLQYTSDFSSSFARCNFIIIVKANSFPASQALSLIPEISTVSQSCQLHFDVICTHKANHTWRSYKIPHIKS